MIHSEKLKRLNSSPDVLPAQQEHPWRAYVLTFAIAFVVLFLSRGRFLTLYDEGITLTAGLRVMAGQVPYRDFYFIYGPAFPYVLAALFRLFGPTVFIAFIFDLILKSAVSASFFSIVRRYCSRRVATFFTAVLIFWLFTLQINLLALTPVSLFSLWTLCILLPVFSRVVSPLRFFAIGAVSGITGLFRLDAGIALVVIVLCMIVVMMALYCISPQGWVHQTLTFALATVAGFAIIVAPVLLLYHAVAPWHDLYFDLFYYPAHYYRASRRLPLLNRADLGRLGELTILIPGITVVLTTIEIVHLWWKRSSLSVSVPDVTSTLGCLCAFGLLASAMYVKSLVRIDLLQNYLALVPTLLLLAILFARRNSQAPLLRGVIYLVVGFCTLCTLRFAEHTMRVQIENRSLLFNELVRPRTQAPLPPDTNWCQLETPATQHLCFLMDPDHLHTVEFLRSNTRPGDTLYVGLQHHDRVFVNDNITYFATQLLPATKWSHFDPFLQNRLDIQQDMVRELETNKPPYVILDAEFENSREPNGSSISTGVHLLDDYISAHYKPVEQYGELTILRRHD